MLLLGSKNTHPVPSTTRFWQNKKNAGQKKHVQTVLFSAPKIRQPHWPSRIAKLNLIARVGKHPQTDMIFISIWHFISQHLSYIYQIFIFTNFGHPYKRHGSSLILILSPLSLRRLFRHKVTVLDMFAILATQAPATLAPQSVGIWDMEATSHPPEFTTVGFWWNFHK